jgi:hypothetical protein
MSAGAIIDELGGTTLVSKELGTETSVVANWRARGSIPSSWWSPIVELAKRRKAKGITFERLAEVQARRPAAEARA